MARHFGPQHGKNDYAALGNSPKRPRKKTPEVVTRTPSKKK